MLPVTYTEENYLKAIYTIQVRTGNEVSVNEIAERMLTRPATVTDMLRKLSDKQLINYEKYKKISLTDSGISTALSVLRKHRLWETFLHKKLNFSWDEVHEVAEQLEHIQSSKLIESLDEFLGYPEYDPHGDPIPKSNGEVPQSTSIPLTDAKTGKQYKIVAVRDTTTAFLQHLERHTLAIGTKINIVEKLPFDNSIIVSTATDKNFQLSEKIANNLLVV